MMSTVEKIGQNAEKEFEAFKDMILLKTKEEIFNDNYKIRFFDELHVFLKEKDAVLSLDVSERESIAEEGTKFIEDLYYFYVKNEYASIENWEEIIYMIRNYCNWG